MFMFRPMLRTGFRTIVKSRTRIVSQIHYLRHGLQKPFPQHIGRTLTAILGLSGAFLVYHVVSMPEVYAEAPITHIPPQDFQHIQVGSFG